MQIFLLEDIAQSEPSAEALFLSAQSIDQGGEPFAREAYYRPENIEQSQPSAQSIDQGEPSATQFFLLEDIEQSQPSAEAFFIG